MRTRCSSLNPRGARRAERAFRVRIGRNQFPPHSLLEGRKQKNKTKEKLTEQSTGPGGGPGDMVLFIEKHNFFPCSFAFFVVRKWKKQEHLEEHLQSIYDGLLGREEVQGILVFNISV